MDMGLSNKKGALFIILITLLGISCKKNGGKNTDKSDAKPACKAAAGLYVMSGKTDLKSYPASVMLNIKRGTTGAVCTGAFVTRNIILTAGHCLEGADQVTAVIENETLPLKKITTKNIVSHPEYQNHGGDPAKNMFADVGLVILPELAVPATVPVKLALAPAKKNDRISWIGFGYVDQNKNGLGVRRLGSNIVTRIDSSHRNIIILEKYSLTLEDPQSYLEAQVLQGDSGAPVYNETGEVVGIVAALAWSTVARASYFVNTYEESARNFITKELPKYDLTPAEEKINGVENNLTTPVPTPSDNCLLSDAKS